MTKKIRIAGTGLDGLVGSRIVDLLKDDVDFIPLPQTKMDIADPRQTASTIKALNFDLFLHMAAYTNVDGAEIEKETARTINVDGTKNVFDAISSLKKPFVYISTDFVFDGASPPFDENSPPHPISYYGQTKYEGEKIVRDRAMIVRLSYPYRTAFAHKTDIVRNILSLLKEKKPIKGIIDQLLTFTFIDDIAYALEHLFNHYSPEIFHIVGANNLSAYDAIHLIGNIFQLDTSLVTKTTYDEFYTGKAERPQKGIIISKKNTFYQMKSFEEGLKEMKKQLLFGDACDTILKI